MPARYIVKWWKHCRSTSSKTALRVYPRQLSYYSARKLVDRCDSAKRCLAARKRGENPPDWWELPVKVYMYMDRVWDTTNDSTRYGYLPYPHPHTIPGQMLARIWGSDGLTATQCGALHPSGRCNEQWLRSWLVRMTILGLLAREKRQPANGGRECYHYFAPSTDHDYRPNDTIPEDYYAL